MSDVTLYNLFRVSFCLGREELSTIERPAKASH